MTLLSRDYHGTSAGLSWDCRRTFRQIRSNDETIYRDDIPRFLEFSKGFIIKVSSTTNSTVTMSIHIEIPWANEKHAIPIYWVHQGRIFCVLGGSTPLTAAPTYPEDPPTPHLAEKWAWPPRRRLGVWGLKTQPKIWPTLGSFWITCYLKIEFPNFLTLDSPLEPD